MERIPSIRLPGPRSDCATISISYSQAKSAPPSSAQPASKVRLTRPTTHQYTVELQTLRRVTVHAPPRGGTGLPQLSEGFWAPRGSRGAAKRSGNARAYPILPMPQHRCHHDCQPTSSIGSKSYSSARSSAIADTRPNNLLSAYNTTSTPERLPNGTPWALPDIPTGTEEGGGRGDGEGGVGGHATRHSTRSAAEAPSRSLEVRGVGASMTRPRQRASGPHPRHVQPYPTPRM